MDIADLLKNRLQATDLRKQFANERKTYSKNWADAVEHFRIKINKQRAKEKLPPFPFIVIRQKLCHIREIDDLRWFYGECLKYEYTRDKFGRRIKGNSFNRAFFGALKVK